MTEIIKEYIETQAEKDAALKASYNPEVIEKCVEYIYKKAEETARSSGFAIRGGLKGVKIEDAVVYKWARDYFIEGIAAKAAETEKAELAAKSKQSEPKEEIEVKPAITTKREEKKQPEQSWLFDFGD